MTPSLKSFMRRFLPQQVAPQRIWSGLLSGYTIVTSWHDYPAAILGYTERPLLTWFAQNVRPGETWLDIGCEISSKDFHISILNVPSSRNPDDRPIDESALLSDL